MTQHSNAGKYLFNPDRAAAVLVDAAFSNDQRAAKKHGVTDRTIRNWRERMEEDAELSDKFRIAYDKATNAWADRLNGAIVSGIEFLHNAARDADTQNPEMVAALGDAWGKLVEARMTVDLLNARLLSQTTAVGSQNGSVAGEAAGSTGTTERGDG